MTSVSAAFRQAAEQFHRNRAALARTQPRLAATVDRLPPADSRPDNRWLYGRDGSLTLRGPGGWWAGCSLPTRAAAQQLKSMDVGGPVACFLDPPTAAHLEVALARLKPAQAIVAVVLDERVLPVLLAAGDFADPITCHRLWIVAGPDWAAEAERLFDENPGLATPTQFVRLALPDAARLDPVIEQAQRVFQAVTQRRSAAARQMVQNWSPPASPADRRLCVVTGRRFALGDEAGVALCEAVAAANDPTAITMLDAEDPASGATLALLSKAVACGALLTADLARADVPDLLPRDLPWLTWMTHPRVPNPAAAGPNDQLLVADPAWREVAIAAGWPASAVSPAGWPAPVADGVTTYSGRFVAIIADTAPLGAPEKLDEFSSHILLWNSLRQELLTDPLVVGSDADGYLRSRVKRFGVDDAALDRRLFVQGLIVPAVGQAVARRLVNDGLPVRLFGTGWNDVPDLAACAAGEVTSRGHLAAIGAVAAAIIDTRPGAWIDSAYALGAPVVRTAGRTHAAIRHDLLQALSVKSPAPSSPAPSSLDPSSLDLSSLVRRLRGRS